MEAAVLVQAEARRADDGDGRRGGELAAVAYYRSAKADLLRAWRRPRRRLRAAAAAPLRPANYDTGWPPGNTQSSPPHGVDGPPVCPPPAAAHHPRTGACPDRGRPCHGHRYEGHEHLPPDLHGPPIDHGLTHVGQSSFSNFSELCCGRAARRRTKREHRADHEGPLEHLVDHELRGDARRRPGQEALHHIKPACERVDQKQPTAPNFNARAGAVLDGDALLVFDGCAVQSLAT